MVKQLSIAAVNMEAVNGTAEYCNPVSDYAQVSELDIEINQMMEKVDILSGVFSTEYQIIGNSNANVKVKVPFCSHSATVEPDAGKFLECAGFTKTTSVVGSTTKYIYTRSIANLSMSISKIFCEAASAAAIVYNAHGVMFNSMKLSLESGKVPIAEFSGIGIAGGKNVTPADVGGISEAATVTKPTIAKHARYTVNDCSTTLGSTAFELNKIVIDVTNKVEQKPVMSGEGFGASQVTGQETKISGSFLVDTALVVQPLNEMRAGTIESFTLTFGQTANRKVTIASTAVQITSVKDAFQGDLLSADITTESIDNVLVITFNSDAVA